MPKTGGSLKVALAQEWLRSTTTDQVWVAVWIRLAWIEHSIKVRAYWLLILKSNARTVAITSGRESRRKRGAFFEEVCEEFLKIYPEGRCRFGQAVNADIGAVDGLMDVIGRQSEFGDPYRLSIRRQKHIYAMLQIGQERIRNVLARSQDND